jgi:hypothetical protein
MKTLTINRLGRIGIDALILCERWADDEREAAGEPTVRDHLDGSKRTFSGTRADLIRCYKWADYWADSASDFLEPNQVSALRRLAKRLGDRMILRLSTKHSECGAAYRLSVFDPDDEEYQPLDWLSPIMRAAWNDGCTMVVFDRKGRIDPRFETFDGEVSA